MYLWFSWMFFHTHFRPSLVGVIISNHELIHVLIVVGGNTSKCSPGRTPLEDMPPLEDAIPPRPVTVPPPRPPAGRAGQLQTNLRMRGIVPQAPQMPTPICQLPLLPQNRQATLYQQLVQLPSKTSGLGVTFDSSASKPAPSDGRDTDVRGISATRDRDKGRQPATTPEEDRRGPLSARPISSVLRGPLLTL